MEAFWQFHSLENIRDPCDCRDLGHTILLVLRSATVSGWLLLSILPLRRLLRNILDIRHLLDRTMAVLPVEMGWLPTLLALPRRVILHT